MKRSILFAALSLVALGGCGHTEQEWQAQLDKYNRLQVAHQASEQKLAQVTAELTSEQQHVAQLTKQLDAAGLDVTKLKENSSKLSASLEERERALADYRQRAKQLEQIKARFDLLKSKLDTLTKLGLAVHIRRNRMVISLPGDVLFDSGKETLKKDGKEILSKIAGVIKNDPTLANRDYEVAGHTDNKPYTGNFRDNWGLSVMRAREVLLYLVDKGSLPAEHWSAAGFADTDPVAPNDSDDGRKKNRRCELVVVPSAEEMLDLRALAQ